MFVKKNKSINFVLLYIGIDRCKDVDSSSCHEYATCKNFLGNYICTCIEGFFGDGKECQGKIKCLYKI